MKIIYGAIGVVWLLHATYANSVWNHPIQPGSNMCYCPCNAVPPSSSSIAQKPIHGTDLETGVYYKLGMLKYPVGWVTWTEKNVKQGSGHYVQLDLNPEREPKYSEGGEWYTDVQWMLQPSAVDGYYLLTNKGLPGMVATWSESENISGGGYHVTIQPVSDSQTDKYSLWKVTRPNNTPKGGKYYQLKPYIIGDGVVTFTFEKFGDYARFIYIDGDARKVPSKTHTLQYLPGMSKFNETFFTFESV